MLELSYRTVEEKKAEYLPDLQFGVGTFNLTPKAQKTMKIDTLAFKKKKPFRASLQQNLSQPLQRMK